ncbi:MAG: LysE family translocator [Chitinophagales bacterium]|nr:LysE family translocator [Chitinophagales bacterium]
MNIDTLLPFVSATFILALMPGPDNLYVLVESLNKGRRNGVAVSLGLASGVMIHTLAAALGLSVIIGESEAVYFLFKILGAAYLFYLAWKAWNEKGIESAGSSYMETKRDPFFIMVRRGFIMNVLNPKVSLFFIAFLPQFVDTAAGGIILQMITLGSIFMIVTIFIFCSIALISGRIGNLLKSKKFWNGTRITKTLILLILAIGLLISGK